MMQQQIIHYRLMNHNFQQDDPYLSIFNQQSSLNNDSLHLYGNNNEQMLQMKQEYAYENMEIQREQNRNNPNSRIVSKSNKKSKAFYRDKMAMLSQDITIKNQEYNYLEYSKSGRGKSPISRQEQLKRNRQSAKLSRHRKKEYLQLLEQKNGQKDKLIQQLSIKLKNSENEREKLKQIDISTRRNFLLAVSECNNKLSQMTKSSIYSDQQISIFIDNIIKKYGAAGQFRIATTNVYIKEVIELLLADIHKYLINCVLNNKGLFGSGKWEIIDEEIAQTLNISKDKRSYLTSKYSEKLKLEAINFKNLSIKLYDTYQAIQMQSKAIQNIFNDIRNQFNAKSLGKTLVWFQQNKFRKQVRKLRAFWMDSVQGDQGSIENIRKQQKMEKMSSQLNIQT